MRFIDQESNSGKIIRALGFGIAIPVALANERASYGIARDLVKEIFSLNKRPSDFSQYFYRLRRQKLVSIKQVGSEHVLTLSDRGEEVFLRFNYEKLKIPKKKIWDRNFRMIIFDVPEIKRKARDSLRRKMKELGLVRFNDSVWVYPYPCQKEIDFVANYWGIGKYVHFALVKDVTNRDRLEKYFDL